MSKEEFTAVMTAEGWTIDEQDELEGMIKEIVSLGGTHMQAKAEYAAAISRWNGGMSAKVATLAGGFEIPNPTGLAGTNPLTKSNLTNNLMSYTAIIQALGTQAHLDAILPLVGSVNVR